MTIAELFKQCRKARGLSLRQAAPLLETAHVHLWEIEQGRHVNVTIKTLRNAQRAYAITTPDLWAAACESLDPQP